MATTEEIERRVEEADATRSAKRSAAARRVGELARLRAEAADKLGDIERELGDVLAESSAFISVAELAAFTDVSAADLAQCHKGRKIVRTKRRRSANMSNAKHDANRVPSTLNTSATGRTDAPSGSATRRGDVPGNLSTP